MKELQIARNLTVRIFDTVDEMPIDRFHRFNKYVMIDSGIGADMESVDQHLSQVKRFISQGEKDRANQKIENIRQSLFFIISGMNPRCLAFAILIHDINGKPVDDFQEESLMKIIERLSQKGLTKGQVYEMVDLAKKKFRDELGLLYPEEVSEGNEISTLAKIKQRALLVGRHILGEDTEKEIEKVTNELEDEIPVENYQGPKGREAQFERDYEKMVILTSEHTNQDPRTMTVKQFYALVNYAKIEAKRRKRATSRRRSGGGL